MEQATYYAIVKYLKEQNHSVTPAELSRVLGKSRVTIQSSLKRLLKNGWVTKEGSSPRTFYRAVDLSIGRLPALPCDQTVFHVEQSREQAREIPIIMESTETAVPAGIGLLEIFVYKCNKKPYYK